MTVFSTRAPRDAAAGYSVVDDRLTIRGELDTDGTVRVDGRVEGAVHRAGTLIVGVNGTVIGDVQASEVVVAGAIQGNVLTTGRIEIEPGAAVYGDVKAHAMVLREGGTVHGLVSIGGGATPTAGAVGGSGSAATGGSQSRRLELAPAPQPQSPSGRARR